MIQIYKIFLNWKTSCGALIRENPPPFTGSGVLMTTGYGTHYTLLSGRFSRVLPYGSLFLVLELLMYPLHQLLVPFFFLIVKSLIADGTIKVRCVNKK
tara:strand:+ start:6148 stop:6441 length:294 start_codon:yes stop_codon:yes gene_type:complete